MAVAFIFPKKQRPVQHTAATDLARQINVNKCNHQLYSHENKITFVILLFSHFYPLKSTRRFL